VKNKRWFLAFMWLILLPALACSTLSGGGEATEAPATVVEVATVAPPAEPSPTATTDPAAGFVSYDSADYGLAFRYPADWFVEDFFFLTLASSEELLAGDTAGIGEGAVMIMIPGSTAELGGSDPMALISTAAEEFMTGDQELTTSNPTAMTIQGQPAAVATINGTGDDDIELEGRMAIIVNGEWAVLAFAATPAADPNKEQHLATIDAVIQTIVVSEPLESELPTPEVGQPADTELVPVIIGDQREDSVMENGAYDYALTLVRGEPVTITADPFEDLDLVLEIYRADDLNVALRSVDDGFSGEPEEIVFAAPADGEYVVRARGFAGAAGSYVLTIAAGGSVDQAEGLTPMALQTAYNEELAGEPAGYLLSLTAGQMIPIILIPETEDQDLVLAIYDLFGNQLARVDEGFSGEPEGLLFQPDADGDYEVRVDAFGTDEGGYMLMAFDPELAFQLDDEVGDDAAVDYRMCVPAGASLVAMALPEDGFDLTITLLGPGGGNLTDDIDDGFSGEAEFVYYSEGASSTEPYPIIVRVAGWAGSSGSFTMVITSTGELPVVQDGC
jgi:hypothetical protein